MMMGEELLLFTRSFHYLVEFEVEWEEVRLARRNLLRARHHRSLRGGGERDGRRKEEEGEEGRWRHRPPKDTHCGKWRLQ